MILPTKRLPEERSLIGIGGEVLGLLNEKKTVSSLWDEFKRLRHDRDAPITFDWFVLALDFLFMMNAITSERGLVWKVSV
jgi:hypothetical protein